MTGKAVKDLVHWENFCELLSLENGIHNLEKNY
jgi:hypothetical protein